MVLSYNNVYGGEGQNDFADCVITVTVLSIIEWEGEDFPNINLDDHADAPMDARADAPEGTSTYTLWTNSNVAISSDQTATSQLTDGTDVLITKYKLSTPGGDGASTTGATALDIAASFASTWTDHDEFLETPLAITHVNTDGGVEVMLSVQATNEADEVADSGDYTATQRLTATWVSDD